MFLLLKELYLFLLCFTATNMERQITKMIKKYIYLLLDKLAKFVKSFDLIFWGKFNFIVSVLYYWHYFNNDYSLNFIEAESSIKSISINLIENNLKYNILFKQIY